MVASEHEYVQAHVLNVGQSSTCIHKKHASKSTQTNTVHPSTLKPPVGAVMTNWCANMLLQDQVHEAGVQYLALYHMPPQTY